MREQLLAVEKVQAIEWREGALYALDQRLLPHRQTWLRFETAAEVADAISDGVVRGAPAIGIAAAYALVLGARARLALGGDWREALEADFARQVMQDIVGEANVLAQEPTMGAEDFSYMLQAKPGAYVFISNGDGQHRELGHGGGPCTLHNPSYDFNDDLIPLGGTYWVELATRWLAQSGKA